MKSVRFSPDGERVLSISHDNTVRIWSDIAHVSSLKSLYERLWKASSYCVSLDAYREMLGVNEHFARRSRERCLRRVGHQE